MRALTTLLLFLALALCSCSQHERDNRFDVNGVAYDPSPEVEKAELKTGVKSLYTHSGNSCDWACLETLGSLLLFLLLTLLAISSLLDNIAEVLSYTPLNKPQSPPSAYSLDIPDIKVPDVDIPSVDLPSLPDFSTSPADYYRALKDITPLEAIKALDMEDIDVEALHLDTVYTELNALKTQLRGLKYKDYQVLADTLQNTLYSVAAKTLASASYQQMLSTRLDSLSIPTDTLVNLVNSDKAALTAYLWKTDTVFYDSASKLLAANLNQSKAPLQWIALHGMYRDLYAAIHAQQSALLGDFLKSHALPDTSISYEQVVAEFTKNSLERLRARMEQTEIAAKAQESSAPAELREFFATYRGRYPSP